MKTELLGRHHPPATTKFLLTILLLACIQINCFAQGTWTAVAAAAPNDNLGAMLLLSDGTVMAKTSSGTGDGIGNHWDRLTPNSSGSYANGTWSTGIAAMHNTRLYFSSQVLKDGRVYVCGGEYGSGGSAGETYNPLTNVWTTCPSPGGFVSDANSEILPDGKVLQAMVNGNLKGNKIYNPVTNTYANGPDCIGIHNESTWVKLPDNSILFVDRLTTNSERYFPSTNTWVADGNVPVALYDPYGYETGPGFLLPDGRAFFIGAPPNTAYYQPSGNSSPGTWTAGPNIPSNRGAPDAAGAMMVNGKILCAVSPSPVSGNVFQSPTYFYEFDYVANSFTQINAPTGGTSINEPSYYTNMLDLPNGQVLFCSQGDNHYYVYTPGGSPLAAGKPTISAVTGNGGGCSATSYTITGTKFNGISEGACYGDDFQMATNYPIVRLTSGSNVYYARTYNWNSTGVQRGSAPDTSQFTLPASLPAGSYSLVVVANGISSDPVSFTPGGSITATITPLGNLDICGTGSVVLQANSGSGYTYQWIKGHQNIPGATNQNYTATKPKKFKVKVTSGTCTATSAFTIVTSSCRDFSASNDEETVASMSIFPNPSENQTTIQFNLPEASQVTLKVFDLSGNEVVTLLEENTSAGTHAVPLNTSEMAKGIYLVRLITENGIENMKLVVQ